MEHIHFTCPQGHKVKANAEAAGRLGRCPQCNAIMMVPAPAERKLVNPRNSITESAVMRVLGDAEPLPPMPERTTYVAPRHCPRCSKSLLAGITICDSCQLYVGLNSITDTRASLSDIGM